MHKNISKRQSRISPLNDRKIIGHLFKEGTYLKEQKLKLKYIKTANGKPQYLVSVSKKGIPKANKRNLLKRWVREAVRNSSLISGLSIDCAIFTTSSFNNEEWSYTNVKKWIDQLLSRIALK